jgi:hypothetical protein
MITDLPGRIDLLVTAIVTLGVIWRRRAISARRNEPRAGISRTLDFLTGTVCVLFLVYWVGILLRLWGSR